MRFATTKTISFHPLKALQLREHVCVRESVKNHHICEITSTIAARLTQTEKDFYVFSIWITRGIN